MKLTRILALTVALFASNSFAGSYGSSYSGSSSRSSYSPSSARSAGSTMNFSPGTQNYGSSVNRSSMKRNSFEKPTSSAETRGKFMKERPISDLTKPAERRKPASAGVPYPKSSRRSPSINEQPSVQFPAWEKLDDGSATVKSTVRITITSDGKKSEQVFVNGEMNSPGQQETD